MDWRYEYVDLEKIRELMEKTDGWEESRQQEFYAYMQEQKDTLFKSEFGDLFLQMYEKKLGERDLEIIRSRRVKHPEPEQKARPFWLWRVLPVLLLSVSVSAGSIWIYRKAQDADAKRHLEQLQAQVGQENGQAQGTGDLEQTGGAPEPGSSGTQPEGAAAAVGRERTTGRRRCAGRDAARFRAVPGAFRAVPGAVRLACDPEYRHQLSGDAARGRKGLLPSPQFRGRAGR